MNLFNWGPPPPQTPRPCKALLGGCAPTDPPDPAPPAPMGAGRRWGGGGLRPLLSHFGDPHWHRRRRVRGVWGGGAPPGRPGGLGGGSPSGYLRVGYGMCPSNHRSQIWIPREIPLTLPLAPPSAAPPGARRALGIHLCSVPAPARPTDRGARMRGPRPKAAPPPIGAGGARSG